MAAYNAYNGIPCTAHPILNDITIEEWGLDEIICTDGGALRMLISGHKYYDDIELAAAASIKAGYHLPMSVTAAFAAPYKEIE